VPSAPDARTSPRREGRPSAAALALRATSLALLLMTAAGCATKGELYAVEERVIDAERARQNQPDPREQIADLSAEVDKLRTEVATLRGQIEVTQKKAEDALAEAKRARRGAVAAPSGPGADAAVVAASAGVAVVDAAAAPPEGDDPAASAEIVAYRDALNAWRENDEDLCIERFRKFLQAYPSSPYADDGAYWMADCHFKKAEYRQAVLRFNDVVRVYPNGNKAADALYRQGESLLKLGPGFYDAAKTVFQQVLADYPDSDRAKEARQQLEAIGAG
jgi:tol-pal system protein YbgF